MLARTAVRRVGLRSFVRRFGSGPAPLTAEQKQAQEIATRLRESRGMRSDAIFWSASSEPFLKPRAPGEKRADWEMPWFIIFGSAMGVLGLAEMYRPDTGPESWARDEAEERLHRRADGEDVERLHNYSPGIVQTTTTRYVKSTDPFAAPRLDGDDE